MAPGPLLQWDGRRLAPGEPPAKAVAQSRQESAPTRPLPTSQPYAVPPAASAQGEARSGCPAAQFAAVRQSPAPSGPSAETVAPRHRR